MRVADTNSVIKVNLYFSLFYLLFVTFAKSFLSPSSSMLPACPVQSTSVLVGKGILNRRRRDKSQVILFSCWFRYPSDCLTTQLHHLKFPPSHPLTLLPENSTLVYVTCVRDMVKRGSIIAHGLFLVQIERV